MKVATLFKSEVRSIDVNCTAGTERMWLKDILFLKKKYKNLRIYAGAKINLPSDLKADYIKIPYPYFLLDFFDKYYITSKSPAIKRISLLLYDFFLKISEFHYALYFVLREWKTDLYYVYQCPLVAIMFPEKTVITWHNFAPKLIHPKWLIGRYRRAKQIYCSQFLKKKFTNHSPELVAPDAEVIPNSVDTSLFRQYPGKKNTIRPLSLGFFSNWNQEKGFYYALDMIKRLNRKYQKQIRFYIAGSIDLWSLADWSIKKERERAEAKKAELEKFDNIVWLGKVNYKKLPRIYNAVDYTLFPSLWDEPFGNVVIESMSCGTPVLGFKGGALSEITDTFRYGYFFEKDTQKIDKKIMEMINIKTFRIKRSDKISLSRYTDLLFSDAVRAEKLSRMLNNI